MSDLRISPDLSLPIEAVTETFAILAKRGAGKTYTASVLAEEMLRNKLQVVVLDPMGAWWGLRSSADGKSEGFEIPILGGEHADVPLEAAAGNVIADLVVDERVSAIIDLSAFSKTDWRRFTGDFLKRVYQRNREPMHIMLEEADLFAPEGKLKRPGDEEMLGAMYDLVRRGRGRGIGSTLITQRSASVSKEVLTQAEILIAMRTTGPNDRKAIESWIEYHADRDERDKVLGEIAGLPTGEAFVWWPVAEVLRRVKIRKRTTFDSSATPKPGETRLDPKMLADVDLDQLRGRMAATIEKAKADDPRELRRRLGELERHATQIEKKLDLAEKARELVKAEPVVERVEVPALTKDERGLLQATAQGLRAAAATAAASAEQAERVADRLERALRAADQPPPSTPRARPAPATPRTAQPRQRAEPAVVDGDFRVTPAMQRILDALAVLETIGVDQAAKIQVALLAGASPKSSGYTNNLGAMRTAGLIHYPQGGIVQLTEAGRAIADPVDAPGTAEEMQAFAYQLVGQSKARILRVLVDAYPEAIAKGELADLAGVSASSSGYTNNLGSLRSLGLIDYPKPGYAAAEPILFLEAGAPA